MWYKLKLFLFENRTTKQIIAKNTFWLGAGEMFSKVFLFLASILVARILGPNKFGEFSFVNNFTSMFGVLLDLGFSMILVREVSRNREFLNKYLGGILLIKIILSVLSLAVVLSTIHFLNKPSYITYYVYLAMIATILLNFIVFFQSIFQALNKMEYIFYSKFIYTFILFGLILAFIKKFADVGSVFSIYIISSIIALLMIIILFFKKNKISGFFVDKYLWNLFVKDALIFALISICVSTYYYFSSVWLYLFTDELNSGWYNAAFRIIATLIFIPSIIQSVFFPLTSKLFISSEKKLVIASQVFFKIMFVIGIFLVLVLCIFGKQIIRLTYGVEYGGAILPLKILSIGLFFAFISISLENLAYSTNQHKIILVEMLLALCINILLSFILISKYKVVGVCLTMSLTWIFEFVFLIFVMYKGYIVNIFRNKLVAG